MLARQKKKEQQRRQEQRLAYRPPARSGVIPVQKSVGGAALRACWQHGHKVVAGWHVPLRDASRGHLNRQLCGTVLPPCHFRLLRKPYHCLDRRSKKYVPGIVAKLVVALAQSKGGNRKVLNGACSRPYLSESSQA